MSAPASRAPLSGIARAISASSTSSRTRSTRTSVGNAMNGLISSSGHPDRAARSAALAFAFAGWRRSQPRSASPRWPSRRGSARGVKGGSDPDANQQRRKNVADDAEGAGEAEPRQQEKAAQPAPPHRTGRPSKATSADVLDALRHRRPVSPRASRFSRHQTPLCDRRWRSSPSAWVFRAGCSAFLKMRREKKFTERIRPRHRHHRAQRQVGPARSTRRCKVVATRNSRAGGRRVQAPGRKPEGRRHAWKRRSSACSSACRRRK